MSAKNAIDGTLGTLGVSSPIWLQYIETGSKTIVLIGGAMLVVIRVAIAIRDWRNGKQAK